MDGQTRRDALVQSATIGIASDLGKHCVSAAAAVRSLNLSLSRLQTETQPQPVTLLRDGSSAIEDADSRRLPSFGSARSVFSKSHAEPAGQSMSSAQSRWKILSTATTTKGASALGAATSFAGLRQGEREVSINVVDIVPQMGGGQTEEAQASDTSSFESTSHSEPTKVIKRALVVDEENSLDQRDDQDFFSSVLAAQTVAQHVPITVELRLIESGQKASLALRPSVVLLKLAPPPMSTPHIGRDAWLYPENDIRISRAKRPSDASGNKLSEDQYYKYVNIDPSTLDAHVRACYRVYFGEQVSVSRPSGRAVPCGPDDGPAPASYDQGWDILMKARSEAKKPFLPYCFWQKNTYVNFEGQRSSNDPFETTSTDPRTRLLIQFQSLHMKLLEHSDFQGVEPLFATAYVYSTGSNVGRRVSEMVHFDFNSEEMLFSTLQPHLSGIDPLSRCTNMLFNLSQRSEHYFLVVIVERLYGSDDDSSYAAPAKILKNPKARAELVQRFAKNSSKYGYLRRPFAWTAHRLFEKSSLVEGPVTLDHFWTLSNEATRPFDLYSAIQLKFASSRSSLEASSLNIGHEMLKIEGSLTFSMHEWRSFCKQRVRNDQQPSTAVTLFDSTRSGITHSDPSVSIFDSMHVVEVLELDSMARLSYSTFNNFVFVAPIAINFANYDKLGAFHAPSLMVSACLCERANATPTNELDDCIEGLQCCIGKSSVPNLVSCSVNSHVAGFTKYPIFHDVMKMTLKPKIAPGTHVLFKVYDVNTKSGHLLSKVSKVFSKGSAASPLKQLIGYAFTPIDGGVSNPASEIDLPLYRELPTGYINAEPADLERYRILPSELPLHVSLTYQSTIQPKHPQLLQFFRDYSCFVRILDVFESLKIRNSNASIGSLDTNLLQTTKRIEDSVCALTTSHNVALHHYFPILCNQILCILCGSLQILAYESRAIDEDGAIQQALVSIDVRKRAAPGDPIFEYTALEEKYLLMSVLYRQRVFGGKDSGSGMWVTLADTALQSLACIFTQIEKTRAVHSSEHSSSPVVHLPGERSIMKRTYVEDTFDNLKNERGVVGFYLILAWGTNLQNRSNADFALNDLEQHIGVLLDIIYKSYVLCFESELSGFPSDDCPHCLEHGPYINSLVDLLMIQLSQKYAKCRTSDPERTADVQMVKHAICELVIFVRDCARIFGSRCSFRFFHNILKHIYSLEDEVMRRVDVYFGSEFFKLRLEVIRVYMDSPYFVPMCRIHTLNIDACVDFDCALSQCPFVALLFTHLDEVTAKGLDKDCAALALAVMFNVLSSFDDDFRLQNAEIRTKIAVMFWPFVRVCLRFFHNLMCHNLSTESWHYLLSCFIFITSNLPTGFMSQWCSSQSPRIISYFVRVLHRAVTEFTIDTNKLVSTNRDSNRPNSSTFFIARSESVRLINRRRQQTQQWDFQSQSSVSTARPKSVLLSSEDATVTALKCSYSSKTEETSEVSCLGHHIFETKIIETRGQQCFFLPAQKHFSNEFANQMVLSVLATLHDVLEQFTLKVVGMQGSSIDVMREDIDVCRLEESVNCFFGTCFSRVYCQVSSSQSIFTFDANFKVWSACLPLVLRCFAKWSAAFPFRTKRWQEFYHHYLNLKMTTIEGMPAHDDAVILLEETLIKGYTSQDLLSLSIQDVVDDTDEKSPSFNKIIKTMENGKKQLLAASEEGIIDALVFREAEFAANFKEIFFCGFRNFITPMRLLCYLMGCVEQAISNLSSHQAHAATKSLTSATIPRVMNLLKYWITTYGCDWDEGLLAAAHVLVERCTAQAGTISMEHSDYVGIMKSSISTNLSPPFLPRRDISQPQTSALEKMHDAGDASSPGSSLQNDGSSLVPEAGSFSEAGPYHASNSVEEFQSKSSVGTNDSQETASVFSIVAQALSSTVSTLASPRHRNSFSTKMPANPRSSNEIIVSTFQVFVRAVIKHLKSSGSSELQISDGAFDALASKNGKSLISRQPGALFFFRQSVDAGDLFLSTSPKHWAQCLTLHSFHIFRKFQAQEFFRQPFPAWQAKPESLKKALVPNISANAEFFNLVKDFFVGSIFRADPASRKRVLMHVIDIAYCMKQLNNFDGMFSSVSALDSVGVFRLKKLWSSVSTPECESKIAELRFLMESRNKYANYTAALRSASPPKLPYVAHFLGSLFMHSERHPKKSPKHDHLVNFGRYYGLHDIVFNDILVHRAAFYTFSGPDDISKEAATELLAYVKAPHSWLLSADEEYERSHRDEPCERVDCHVCQSNRRLTLNVAN